jgi:hypothetical protein
MAGSAPIGATFSRKLTDITNRIVLEMLAVPPFVTKGEFSGGVEFPNPASPGIRN